MKISYAVTTHNEHKEIKQLLPLLIEYKDPEDEIIVVDDHSDEQTQKVFIQYKDSIKLITHKFNGNFSDHKNFMISQCTGEWIFNLDADEVPDTNLIKNVKQLNLANPVMTDLSSP